MRRGMILLTLIAFILLIYPVSAEIIMNQQLEEVYSLGDVVQIPATIKSSTDLSGIFNMDLLCNGRIINFYKNGISLSSGEEKKIDASLVLTKDVIEELTGICKVKITLGKESVLTKNFKISNLITMNINFDQFEFNPGENIFFEGNALKENGKDVNGFIELLVEEGNNTKISQLETINNGFFKIDATMPKDMKAGTYLMRLNAYEKSVSGEKTNVGFIGQNIIVRQIPTSLEIIFDTAKVEPGTNLKVKAILHDQTGEKISSNSFLTIKNQNDKILEQTDIATDEFFEFPIQYNQKPSEWTVVAASSKLTSEAKFQIIEKELVKVDIINKTILITNKGNVPFNDTVLVKIGNESLNIDVYLPVDSDQIYTLTAPDGNYQVEIITGTNSTSAQVALTGKSIDVRKASNRAVSLIKYPLAWIFLIIILGFVAFVMFKRSQQQTFFGYIGSKIPKKKINSDKEKGFALAKSSLVNSKNKASLSLSIKGHKQNASIVSLKFHNLKELQSKPGNEKETLQEIVDLAEEKKAVTYETNNGIFFILAPTRTKTFGNEKTALEIAVKIKSVLDEHNKKFKQKIDFGISITSGTIVAKQDSSSNSNSFQFMTLGSLMGFSKKLSGISKSEILLDEKTESKLKSRLKTKEHGQGPGEITYYSIKEIKNPEQHEKFLKNFLHKLEHGEKDNEKKKD